MGSVYKHLQEMALTGIGPRVDRPLVLVRVKPKIWIKSGRWEGKRAPLGRKGTKDVTKVRLERNCFGEGSCSTVY